MSRAESSSSIFSHISSVSQQFEAAENTPSKRRGRPAKKVMPRLMDDNELSIKKATEEAFDAQANAKSRSIQRRKSDLSSSSSSSSAASSVANKEAIARLRANMQKIPATFGSNDQEVRVTRSKLRSIIEHKDSDSDSKASSAAEDTKLTRRVTRRVSKKLAQVKEEEVNSPKMSISNLKKHNAAYEKLDAIADLVKKEAYEEGNEEGDEMTNIRNVVSGGGKRPAAKRVTRSMVSVSPNASSCVSESTLVTVASTSAVKTPKKVGRK